MPKLSKKNIAFLARAGLDKVKSHMDPRKKMAHITNQFVADLQSRTKSINTVVAGLRDLRQHLKMLDFPEEVIRETFRPEITIAMNEEREKALAKRNKTAFRMPPDFSNLEEFQQVVHLLSMKDNVFYDPALVYDAMIYMQVGLSCRLGEFKTLVLQASESDDDQIEVLGSLKKDSLQQAMPLVTAAKEDDLVRLWLQWDEIHPREKRRLIAAKAYPKYVKKLYGFTTHTLRKIGATLAVQANGGKTELSRYVALAAALRHKADAPVSLSAYGNVETV